jgi:S-adenosyl-L-methionine hydrolase (adenosine-forming)
MVVQGLCSKKLKALITLTTDFGTADWFVGVMKGVITGIAPQTQVTDLTHAVPAGDVRAGAFVLAAAYRFFPRGTIHVVVVDPGVGSQRKAIVVQTRNYRFIGPDNGVLSWALRQEKITAVRSIENTRYFLQPVSRTFHGRDVFAPVAAHLSAGILLARLGPAQADFIRLPWNAARREKNSIRGEIVYIDRFGNCITNIEDAMLARLGTQRALEVLRGRKRLCPVADYYQAVPAGQPVAVSGSSGFLEIAVNRSHAASILRLRIGDPIKVRCR